eukprot:6517095-Pyramimonas_sp.AAC.1
MALRRKHHRQTILDIRHPLLLGVLGDHPRLPLGASADVVHGHIHHVRAVDWRTGVVHGVGHEHHRVHHQLPAGAHERARARRGHQHPGH